MSEKNTPQNTEETTATTKQTIALAKGVQGRVIMTDDQGVSKTVKAQQELSLGDTITTKGGSATLIDFGEKGAITLGHDQSLKIDKMLMDLLDQTEDEEIEFTPDDLQQAIEEGANLEELLPATAAGEQSNQSVNGSSVSNAARLELTGQEVTPESGFETSGLTINSSSELLPQGQLDDAFLAQARNAQPQTSGIVSVSVNQDSPLSINIANAFSDANSDQVLTYTADGLPEGFVLDSSTGIITGTPTNADALANGGLYNIDVTATDSSDTDNNTVATSFELQINNVNDAPIVNNAIFLAPIDEDNTVTILPEQLLVGSSDIDGDTLNVTNLVIIEGAGELTVLDDGNSRFTPEPNWNGNVTISFNIDDGQGGQTNNIATFPVQSVNDIPIAEPDGPIAVTSGEPIVIDVLANDTDIDGDMLTIMSASAENGTVVVQEDGTLLYTPDVGASGDSAIRYQINDGNGGTSMAIATVSVSALSGSIAIADTDASDSSEPVISGTAANIEGDLTLSINGNTYQVPVNDDGTWIFTLPPSDALMDGNYPIVVSGTSINGELISTVGTVVVDLMMPSVTINDIDTSASASPLFSGSSANTDGDLTLNVNNQNYSVTPDSDGNWSFTLPAVDVLEDGDYTATITGSDVAGNTVSDSDDFIVDAQAPIVTIDDIDVATSSLPTFTGQSSYTDGAFTLSVNGNDYTVIPADDGSWSFTLPAGNELPNASYIATISGSDDQGNSVSASDAFLVTAIDIDPRVDGLLTGVTVEGDLGDISQASGTIAINEPGNPTPPSFADTIVTGTYGTLTLTNGAWNYVLDQSLVQDLNAGDVISDAVTLTATDGTEQQVVIAIQGSDDASALTGDFSATVLEADLADVVTASGTIQVDDVDSNDNPTVIDTVQSGSYGQLVLTSGEWTYTLDQTSVQTLNDGDSLTETFTVTTSDGLSEDLVITILGTNDTPIVSGDASGAVVEGDIGDVATVSGSLTITDIDTDDSPTFPDNTIVGTFGSLELIDGNWTYTLDQAAAQSLSAGEVVNDVLTIAASDGSTQDITIAITGTNDLSVITGDSAGALSEGDLADVTTATGSLAISDVDGDDSPTFPDATVTGTYGSLALVDGDWTYTLDQASVQSLDDGEVVTDTLTVTASDGSTQDVTLTITGTDDAPVVTGDTTGAVTEGDVGDVVTSTGALSISDADGGDSPSFADDAQTGTYGSIALVGGTWTYTLNQAAVQSLDAGDSVDDSFTFTASDGTDQTVVVTVTGTDDTSVISGDSAGALSEGDLTDVTTATGSLAISDVDGDDSPTFPDATVTGTYGSLALVDGDWTYTLDQASVQSLDDGDVVTDTLTVTASDGSTQDVTLTITGTDDAAVISGDTSGAVSEGDLADVTTATGSLAISDVDSDDSPTFPDATITGTYGSLALVDGDWTYTLDQASVQSLDDGEVVTDTLTITASDGSTQDVTLTITGTDDAAVISGDTSGAVSEGDLADITTATGSLAISDVDGDDSPTFLDATITGTYGSLALVDGDWTYTLDQASVQSLDDGEVVTDTLTITASDGSTQDITLTITGTDNAPVVTGDTTGSVTEGDVGDVATATGASSISDADDGDSPSFADDAQTGTYGSIALVGGTWTYTLNQAAAQSLDAGDSVDDSFTFTASDGTDQTVVITVTGTDDASIISGDTSGAVSEGDLADVTTATGSLAISDVDGDDSPTFPDATITGTYGSLALVDGDWTYTLDQASVQSLDDGEVVTDTLTVTASDGSTQDVTLTITGTDNAPVVTGDTTGSVTEGDVGDVATATGALSISDADDGDSPSFADDAQTGTYGSIALVSGTWTYTLNQAAAQSLDAGDSVDDSFTFTASDGTDQTVVVTITGTDDTSVISGDSAGALSEGDLADVTTATGSLAISDVDGDDSPTFLDATITGTYGSLALVDGDWTYTLDQASVQSLDDGEVVTDTLIVTASDGSTQDVTLTITGTDNAPVVTGDTTGAVTEGDVGDVATATGALSISDADDGDSPSFADDAQTGTYGSIALVSGTWTYTLNQAAAQSLDAGDNVDDSFTFTASDGTDQTVVVTITGTNDVPEVTGATGDATADSVFSGNVPVATDVDGDDTAFTYSIVDDVTEGSLTFNSDGSYSFDPGSDFNDLAFGDSRDVSFTYIATDAQGGQSTPATITINVENDSVEPVVTVVDDDVTVTTVEIEQEFDGDPIPTAPGSQASDANGVDASDFTLDNPSNIEVTFVSESAGFSNSLGWYQISDEGQLLSADLLWLDSNNIPAGDSYTINNVDRTEIGFFLIQNGFSRYQTVLNQAEAGNGVLRFENSSGELATASDNGVALVYYTSGDQFNPSGTRTEFRTTFFASRANLNEDGVNHTRSGTAGSDANTLRIGFEDLLSTGDSFTIDWDLRDFIFDVSITSVELSRAEIAPSLTISDDGSQLVAASAQLMLGRENDELAVDNATADLAATYGIAISYDDSSKTLSLSGTADIAEYQEILAAIQLSSTDALGSEPRAVRYSVEDTDGFVSDVATVNLNADAAYDFTSNDVIIGDGLADIIGGEGDDLLIASADSDTFVWRSGDDGSSGIPSTDTVRGFTLGTGGDTLDISDLLQGESNDAVTLDAYLDFSSDGGDTTMTIDADGNGANGVTQSVIIEGIDLTTLGNDQQIIQQLLNDGNLSTD